MRSSRVTAVDQLVMWQLRHCSRMFLRSPSVRPSLRRENSVVGIAAAAALATFAAVSQPHTGTGLHRAALVELPLASEAARAKDSTWSGEEGQQPSQLGDEGLSALLIGRWRSSYHGELIVENRADGTASMRLTFDFLASLYYGPALDLSMTWSVKDGVLGYDIQSGVPHDKWNRFKANYGDRVTYNFETVAGHELWLSRVIDPGEKFHWVRLNNRRPAQK